MENQPYFNGLLGTPKVESLASYIHRLSAAHGLPTWVLVCRELALRFERKSIMGTNGYCDLFGRVGMTINGNNGAALEMVTILQTLTGQTTLGSLTFCRLGNLVAESRILRKSQAWCPDCLNYWRQVDQPIYQPLIWLLSQLKTCPTHGCALEDHCPRCDKQHTSLTRYRWTGHCPRCSAWLGNTSLAGTMITNPLLSEWDKHSEGAIGRFVAAIQLLSEETPRSTFSTNIGSLVHKQFAGNFSALARIMHVRGFSVSCWAHGTQRPSPASLLALSFCFGGEMLDWVVANMESAGFHDPRPMSQSVAEHVRRPLQRQNREVMQERLALVAQKSELPPPSFRTVCRRLGLDQTVASRSFPDLAEVIKARHKSFLAEAKSTRELYRRTAVASAVKRLQKEGITLSYKHLREVLPPDFSTRDKLVRTEFRQQLGDVDNHP